ncbi:MAG: hypothetical protein LRY73_14710 [Bacillus sp. (in: Bacteria)]|nr:hypothetical protein [Bacillus sp. (in: firmicutes)]
MNEQIKKVDKYFPDTEECLQLKQQVEHLKHIKDKDEIPIIKEAIDHYQEIMSTTFIHEKLTLNYVKAVILAPLFGQPSFLQPTFNAKSTQEHIDKLNTDFVKPAMLELSFNALLTSSASHQEILTFLEENQQYEPFKLWLKKIKKLPLENAHDFFATETLPCSFIDGFTATQSFEEKVFSPLALSKDKAVNFSWDFNKKRTCTN